jgi:hypothetical protein
MKTPAGSNNVRRLFPEAANQNERGLAISWAVSVSEGAHAGKVVAPLLPPPLQALAPDPWV